MIIWKLETLARAREIQTTTSISPFFSVESRTIPIRVVLRFGEKCVLQPRRGLILTGDRDSPTLKTREKDRIFGPVSISKYKMSGMSGGGRETDKKFALWYPSQVLSVGRRTFL